MDVETAPAIRSILIMKRCPQCNRVEADEALGFCRSDGTPLLSDSANFDPNAGTMRLYSGPVVSESETRLLDPTSASTNPVKIAPTAPTTVLVTSHSNAAQKAAKPKTRLGWCGGLAIGGSSQSSMIRRSIRCAAIRDFRGC